MSGNCQVFSPFVGRFRGIIHTDIEEYICAIYNAKK